MEQYTPMIRQYLEIKAMHQDAFLFFRLGDFYELFFDDAIAAARELEITLTARDGGATERIPMCGVPHHAAEGYIKTLVQRGYKVAICDQVEDPKEAKGVVKREVTRIITPGTVMDSSMLSSDNNFLAAIIHEHDQFGIAFCDLTTGEFYVPLYLLDGWISVLEEILPYAPKEIVLSAHFPKDAQLQLRAHVHATFSIVDDVISSTEANELLQITFAKAYQQLPQLHIIAAGQLLHYIKNTQKRSIEHFLDLRLYEPNRHMILDPFTRRNLEVVETVRNKTKHGSLLWLLDRTVTPMGGRLLKKWLDKPLMQEKQIEERQDVVQFFLHDALLRTDVRQLLKEIYDLERLAGRVAYGNVNGRDLVQLRNSLMTVPQLLSAMKRTSAALPANLLYIDEMDDCQDIWLQLHHAVVDNPPITITEGGLIKDGYDIQLDELREASRSGKQWLAQLEQQERNLTGIKTLKIGYNKVFGYYIEVTKANLALLPDGRYERKQTLANAERFVTLELKEKEALILQAEERMMEIEYTLFHTLRTFLQEHIPRIQRLAQQIAMLDVFVSLAEIAEEKHYVRPAINTSGELNINHGRHPVIEAVLEKGHYIPNSTHLHADRLIYLITGPNMAGKSTYMRQVAIIQIMFQMGAFVPAEEASLAVVDRIFTRIGAADDIVEGQSTFMVEMNEIKVTTTQATAGSLVIIDELGRGTSTQDGIAIAQAVIEFLHDKIGCKTLVSTHFHELATLESRLPKLMNYHMAVKENDDDVLFTRQLIAGATSKSYGIYCAQLAGVPPRIIDRAHVLMSKLEKSEHLEQLDLFIEQQEVASSTDGQDPMLNSYKEVVEQIYSLDLPNMTPMQALQVLYDLKHKIEDF